jgi:murein DD-endopeptidase MepM/ murein hydrolase activator NlpD
MSKLFNVVGATMLAITLIFPSSLSNISIDAVSVNNISTETLTASNISSISSLFNSSQSKAETKIKKKVKIINNEIQEEDGVILNKKDQERYDNCKKEVMNKRVKRYKNKPTPCFKLTNTENNKDSEITPEDYNILWATVAENKELIETKVDPNKELLATEFLNLSEVEIVSNNSSISSSNLSNSSFLTSLSSTTSSLSLNDSSNPKTESSSSKILIQLSKSSSSSQKTSLFDSLFSFGSIKASATINDGFKIPYENGIRANLTQTSFNKDTDGIWGPGIHASHWDYSAFDFVGEGSNYKIVSTKPGKVVYSADTGGKGFGSHIVISHNDGSYALYGHLNARNVSVGDNISQAQYIGNEGSSGGQKFQHLHFETFNRYPCVKNNISYNVESCFIDNAVAYGGKKGNDYYLASSMRPTFVECTNNNKCTNGYPDIAGEWYTSQNSTKPATFNNYSGTINFYGWQFDVQNAGNVSGNGTFQGTPVQIRQAPNGVNEAQKWFFDQQGKEIKGMNDYCLDAGDSQGRLVIWTCNGTNNQKWTFYPNGLIKNLQTNQCINIPNGYANAVLGFSYCGSTGYQVWSTTNIWLPGRVAFKRENTNQCLASYSPYNLKSITTQDCNNNDESQQWEWVWANNGYVARRFGTNYCLDTYNPTNNSSIYSYDCNWSDAQKWWYGSNKLLSRTAGNSNGQCAAKYNPQNGNNINAYQCNSNNYNDGNLRWDAYGV